jgi:hypothetical protein
MVLVMLLQVRVMTIVSSSAFAVFSSWAALPGGTFDESCEKFSSRVPTFMLQ